MLELTKSVLEKVSFDKSLFCKELKKSKDWLQHKELLALKAWCLATFVQYQEEISEILRSAT